MPEIYLSLMTGRTPDETRPVLITRDPQLLRAFGEAVRRRVEDGVAGPDARAALTLLEAEAEEEGST